MTVTKCPNCGHDDYLAKFVALRDAHATIDRLTAALRPFAALHRERVKWGSREDVPDDTDVWGFDEVSLTHGDFRRATEALAAAPSEETNTMTTDRQMRDAQLIINQQATIDRLTAERDGLAMALAELKAWYPKDRPMHDRINQALGYAPDGEYTTNTQPAAAPSEETNHG